MNFNQRAVANTGIHMPRKCSRSGVRSSLWTDTAGSLVFSITYVFKLVNMNHNSLTEGVHKVVEAPTETVPTSGFLYNNADKL